MATTEKRRGTVTGFNLSAKECVWMKAKVVPVKYCDNAFDCTTCAFDKAMAKRMAKESPSAGWKSKMAGLPPQFQRCRHALTGNAPAGKLCAHGYECGHCPYDQMLEDLIFRTPYDPGPCPS